MLRPHRSRPSVAAVVGLLAGLALLVGAVLDGGMASPTRHDGPDGVAAVPHSEVPAASVPAREDQRAWGTTLPVSRIAILVAGLVGLAGATTVVAPIPVLGPSHRAPALRAARHRGPPAVA